MKSVKTLASLFTAVAMLSACGGGDDAEVPPAASTPSAAPAPAPVSATGSAPGGLYVGYYQEDPSANPEDPTLGAFTMSLPTGSGNFSGSMFFTYVGCQASNVGTISGSKTGVSLSGSWSGSIDGSPQSGTYFGSFDTANGAYAGTYANAGGKQYRDLAPCIRYWIGPNGTWEMFPIEHAVPSTFSVVVKGRTISWSAVPSADVTLVYVLDPTTALVGGNPVVWQTLSGTGTSAVIPSGVAVEAGREYIAVVSVAAEQHKRAAFGSRRFTP
jgi:hypothetical protein